MKKKKILLSAYACEPNKGSEPGIGWNWALQLCKMGHDIKIITRSNNKKKIEQYLNKNKVLKKEFFFYYDLPKIFQIIKKYVPGGIYIYYYLWQYFMYHKVKNENFIKQIDIVHHLTFGVFRIPSFLWKLNKKFIFGPVGGHEIMPHQFFKELNFKNKIIETIRLFSNFFFIKFDKNLENCIKNSSSIFSRTDQTKFFLKKYFKKKIITTIDIGTNFSFKKKNNKKNILKLLFVGRLIYWKGVDILIDSFNLALKKNKNLSLTICGLGKEKKILKKKINYLGINNKINFTLSTHNKINYIYRSHDIFVFPSLHDSSGNVLMEALSNSLPVICYNLGGPGKIINNKCGVKISTNKKSRERCIKNFANKILHLANDQSRYNFLSKGAYTKSKFYSWNNIVKRAYKMI